MPLSKDSRHLEPAILDFGGRLGHEVNQQAWSHWHFPSIVTNDLATCLAKPLPTDQEAILLTYGESLSEIGGHNQIHLYMYGFISIEPSGNK